MERRRLINVALGREPADVIVAGGQVLSVHTGEILGADVAIVGSRIAAVGQLPSAIRGPSTRVIVIPPDPKKDVAMTAMIDRLGKGSGMSVAFIKGFHLKAGAIASTHNAVCENLAIVGTNGADMAFAAGELRRMGGGQIVVRDGKVLAAFRMPILGLFSDQPYEEVLERRREIQAAAESLGCTLNDPLLKLEFSYACAEFPLLRMSEEGLFRTDTKEHLSVVA